MPVTHTHTYTHTLSLSLSLTVSIFLGVAVECDQVSSLDMRHTVDHRNDVLMGEAGLQLRQRLRVIQASLPLRAAPLPPYIAALLTPSAPPRGAPVSAAGTTAQPLSCSSPAQLRAAFARSAPSPYMYAVARGTEGVSLEVAGVRVTLPYRVHMGLAMDAVMNHVSGLTELITSSSGSPWHRTDARHWRYFSRPPPSGFDVRCGEGGHAALGVHVGDGDDCGGGVGSRGDDGVVPCIPKVWLQCSELAFVMQDDPWEAWLGQVRVGDTSCCHCCICCIFHVYC